MPPSGDARGGGDGAALERVHARVMAVASAPLEPAEEPELRSFVRVSVAFGNLAECLGRGLSSLAEASQNRDHGRLLLSSPPPDAADAAVDGGLAAALAGAHARAAAAPLQVYRADMSALWVAALSERASLMMGKLISWVAVEKAEVDPPTESASRLIQVLDHTKEEGLPLPAVELTVPKIESTYDVHTAGLSNAMTLRGLLRGMRRADAAVVPAAGAADAPAVTPPLRVCALLDVARTPLAQVVARTPLAPPPPPSAIRSPGPRPKMVPGAKIGRAPGPRDADPEAAGRRSERIAALLRCGGGELPAAAAAAAAVGRTRPRRAAEPVRIVRGPGRGDGASVGAISLGDRHAALPATAAECELLCTIPPPPSSAPRRPAPRSVDAARKISRAALHSRTRRSSGLRRIASRSALARPLPRRRIAAVWRAMRCRRTRRSLPLRRSRPTTRRSPAASRRS